MRVLAAIAATVLALCACSPSSDSKSETRTAEKWPPKDYTAFAARPPMSVGAELEDTWTLTIDSERWSYRIGRGLEGLGAPLPDDVQGAGFGDEMLVRAHLAQRNASIRLALLQQAACGPKHVATPADCAAFAPPAWFSAAATETVLPPKDELLQRNHWFYEHADQFVLPACAKGQELSNNPDFCTAE